MSDLGEMPVSIECGPEDTEIPRCVSIVEEAIELLRPLDAAWERPHHD